MNLNKVRHQIKHGKEVSPQIRFAVELVKNAKQADLHKAITPQEFNQEMRLAQILAR